MMTTTTTTLPIAKVISTHDTAEMVSAENVSPCKILPASDTSRDDSDNFVMPTTPPSSPRGIGKNNAAANLPTSGITDDTTTVVKKKGAKAMSAEEKALAAKARAAKKAEAEAEKQRKADARAAKKAEAEAEKQRKADARAAKKAEAEAEKQRKADARAAKKAEAEAEKQRKADARAAKKAERQLKTEEKVKSNITQQPENQIAEETVAHDELAEEKFISLVNTVETCTSAANYEKKSLEGDDDEESVDVDVEEIHSKLDEMRAAILRQENLVAENKRLFAEISNMLGHTTVL